MKIIPTNDQIMLMKSGHAMYKDGHAYYFLPYVLVNYNDNGNDNYEFKTFDEIPKDVIKRFINYE